MHYIILQSDSKWFQKSDFCPDIPGEKEILDFRVRLSCQRDILPYQLFYVVE